MAKSDMNDTLSVADTSCEVIKVDKNRCEDRGCLSGVCCTVENCRHHAIGNLCTAPHIDVKTETAVTRDQTFCSTFAPLDTRL